MTTRKPALPALRAGGLLLTLLASCGAAAPLPLVLPLLVPPAPPPATRNGPDHPPPAVTAGFGPLTLRAAAAETEDYSGDPSGWGKPAPRVTKDGWTLAGPQNMDNHPWTGTPALRLLLAFHNSSPDSRQQAWAVEIERLTPQWGPPVTFRRTARGRSSASFPVPYHGNGDPTPAWPFVSEDWQIGAGWAGRQHWVRVDGWALRSVWRTETVTLHDAALVHDAGFGGDRIVWRHPETVTTPSGISVTALNGKAGVPDQGPGLPYAPVWRFDGGRAEMLLAWRLPTGLASEGHAAFNDPAEAGLPRAVGPLTSEPEWFPPLLWGALAVPGTRDAGALKGTGLGPLKEIAYEPLRLSLQSSVRPPLDPSRLPRRDGPFQIPRAPLPASIKTITFQIRLREEQERHPFHLWVPVRAAFPPGWEADAADSRSRN